MSAKSKVLLIEDTPSLARLYAQYLANEPVDVTVVETGREGMEALANDIYGVVLLDLQLPDVNGIEILKKVNEQEIPTAVVIIIAHGSINVAVEAMRYGAYDFIVKPFNADRLKITVHNAIERQKLNAIVETIKDEARDGYHGFIGKSLAMQAVYRIIDSAATSKATVFITGESGTGKELCAEAIHRESNRASGPFIPINCGAIPRDLMESEIFGHRKGAFTGATGDRDGAATLADGGALFLDEIGEMDLDLQKKLLRFVQTGTFTKVGGEKSEKVDVRFICATNKDPLAEVEAGRFREDLYYRLHVVPISMPPLRDRENDVLHIARKFLTTYAGEEGKQFKGFSSDSEAALITYNWPGNVRQLQNVVRNVVVLHDGEEVSPEMFPEPLNSVGTVAPIAAANGAGANGTPSDLHSADNPVRPLWEVEEDAIERAIAACDGNVPRAAAMLEISPSTIYRKRLSWKNGDAAPAAE